MKKNRLNQNVDFAGYATKNDLRCTDGVTIRHNAFKDCDGVQVPLVWQHNHDDPTNVLGHAILENRDDGVYAYCYFNDSQYGKDAKALVKHGDLDSLSIYANNLAKKGMDVVHGIIREVSLVIAGANPGAKIDFTALSHSEEGTFTEVIIEHAGDKLVEVTEEMIKQAAEDDEPTIEEIIQGMTPDEQTVLWGIVGEALGLSPELAQSALEQAKEGNLLTHSEGGTLMKNNLFDQYGNKKSAGGDNEKTLTHAERQVVFQDIMHSSLKEGMLKHGITNIELLFPEAKTLEKEPIIYKENGWIADILGEVYKAPYSRIKTLVANFSADEARAKGYIKGNKKLEQVFPLMKRESYPQTVYKKQQLDRDDIIDITEYNVVNFVQKEMRAMLNEEIARAILIGDGRDIGAADKIDETKIRPIATDTTDNFYAIAVDVEYAAEATEEEKAVMLIKRIIQERYQYKGSGSPKMYIGQYLLGVMLLLEDGFGRPLYNDKAALATRLRVSGIVEIPDMDDVTTCACIIVNLRDYAIGTDRGGEITTFDDFDIDYNKYKYLIETRLSGMLRLPKSAMVFTLNQAGV